jgi:flagellar protein FlbD
MIELHRLNNIKILINSDLIECVEETPDTVITLITGNKYVVQEKFDDILDKIIKFRKKVGAIYLGHYKTSIKENNNKESEK